jgi:hypothetical protein
MLYFCSRLEVMAQVTASKLRIQGAVEMLPDKLWLL